MKFKDFLESLAGPGGGPEDKPENLEKLAKEIARKGAGALPVTGDLPPKPIKTATNGYEAKFMKKK